jgi:hypothetical protein
LRQKTFSTMKLRFTFLFFAKLLFFSLLLTNAAFGQITRYVSVTGINTNPISATSWATATAKLQGAIDASQAGDVVWVRTGTYTPGPSRGLSFAMKNGVAIYGGFLGTETALSQRPAITLTNPSATTLSGELGTPGLTTDNSYHVIDNPSGLTNTAILDGFVITAGNANATNNDNAGGGMYNDGRTAQGCSPQIRKCLFISNQAVYGGAIFNNGNATNGNSSPLLINCDFRQNTASGDGGAVFNFGTTGVSSPQLTNCSFQSNSATAGGGAMYNNGNNGISSPGLTNCSFQGNKAQTGGNALFNRGTSNTSQPLLTNCVLFGNGGNSTIGNLSASLSASYSLFENTVTGYTGTNNLTTTTSPFATTTGPQLATSSPAIDAGNGAATALTSISTDLAGNARVVGCRVDMGAVEFQANTNQPLAITNQPPSTLNGCSGGGITASINVSGTVLGYQWYKGSPAVSLGNSQTTSALNLTNLQASNAGSYLVAIVGACNSLTSNAVMLTISTLSPSRFYVNASVTGANTGLSWPDAYTSLQSVLQYPCLGPLTEIWVAAGVYKPGTNRGDSFSMLPNVAIYGGFLGTETALSQRPALNPMTGQPSNTTLSGEIGNPSSSTDNSYHVIDNPPGLTNAAILDGFVITGGYANATVFPDFVGGAMFNNGSGSGRQCSPTIQNCSFLGNAASSGGAVFNSGSSSGVSNPVITNCVFQNNLAGYIGGAMVNNGQSNGNSNPTLTNCLFQNNAVQANGIGGGAIYNNTFSLGISSPTITNCTFLNNQADNAGAIYNDGYTGFSSGNGGSSPRIINCLFQGNSARAGGAGGAIVNDASEGLIQNVYYAGFSSPILTNCVFLNNTATAGGAIFNYVVATSRASRCNPTLTNCSFQGNSGITDGGVLYVNMTVSNITTSTTTFINCAFWNNSANKTFGKTQGSSSTIDARACLFEPAVIGYTDAGGNFTAVASPFASNTTCQLNTCSAAINTGYVPNYFGPTTDLAGNPRFRAGRLDLGAYQAVLGVPNSMVSVQNGAWDDVATWSCGNRLPLPGEGVGVRHTISIPAGYPALGSSVLYGAGSRLIYDGTGARLQLGQ